MGFLKPDTAADRLRPSGARAPAREDPPDGPALGRGGLRHTGAVHLFYVVKILLYILVAWLFASTTNGIGGFTNVASWYAEPIVFEKVVLYTMLFEVIGLGCGFGPLNNRFFPPMGSILYWMRFGTIRLPPWPDRVPRTRGTKRTPVDVALYALLLLVTAGQRALLRRHRARYRSWARRSGCCRRGRSCRSGRRRRCSGCATR